MVITPSLYPSTGHWAWHPKLKGYSGSLAFEKGSFPVLLTGAFAVTGRLWLPIGIHTAWNFTQGGIFGITVSGHPGEGLLNGTLTGPEWVSGCAFGAEASVVATVLCFVVGLTFFALAVQKKRTFHPCWKQKL
jgi:hypothetical protein